MHKKQDLLSKIILKLNLEKAGRKQKGRNINCELNVE